MSTIELYRISDCSKQTMGRIICGEFTCAVLELPWRSNRRNVSRILPGEYACSFQVSPRFGNSIRIHDVPGRDNIVIHVGNYVGSDNPRTDGPDSRGCPIVGTRFHDIDGDGILDVVESRKAVDGLVQAFGRGDGRITISDKYLRTLPDDQFRELAHVEGFLIGHDHG